MLSPVFLGERFRPRDGAFLVVLAIGMLLCVVGRPAATATAPNPALGDLLGAASGFVWALTLVTLRYVGRADTVGASTISAVVAGNAFACLGALPIAWPLPAAPPAQWATLVYLGVFQIGLAYVLLTAGIRHVPALEASVLLLLEPALNPVWAWLVHGETPGPWAIAGGILILGATILRTAADTRVERQAPAG